MLRLSCRYNQARMPAFVSGDLPVETRRFIARHMETCPACRAEYERQKAAARNFTREMPVFASPLESRLDTLWASIAQELKQTPAPETALPQQSATMPPKLRYGFAVMMFIVAIMVMPSALRYGVDAQPGVPSQPVPQLLIETPARTETALSTLRPTAIAQMQQTESVEINTTPALLENTPATPEPIR
ncbi:MAG: anti-sigma factor family protein [Aggregatilineales bacterium]